MKGPARWLLAAGVICAASCSGLWRPWLESRQIEASADMMPATYTFEPQTIKTSTPVGDLYGIWGSDAFNVWAVGGVLDVKGSIVRWDGSDWYPESIMPTPMTLLESISGSSKENVFAAGQQGLILRWDGSVWSDTLKMPSGPFYQGIWATNELAIWMAGNPRTVQVWTGNGFIAQSVPTSIDNLFGIWGSAPDDVWVVGQTAALEGTAMRWQRPAFQNPMMVPDVTGLSAVWGSDADNVWIGGGNLNDPASEIGRVLKRSGTTWTLQTKAKYAIQGIWGTAADNVWAVGMSGTILHWDGSQWSNVEINISPRPDLYAVWGSSENVWIVGSNGTILKRKS